jgi:isoleucyl-tRNA synthetase
LSEVRINLPELERLSNEEGELYNELRSIFLKELNVKNVVFDPSIEESFAVINTDITPELKLEGEMREVVRAIQEGRKRAKFNVEDRIVLGYVGKEEVFAKFETEIAHEVLATTVQKGALTDAEYQETVTLDDEEFTLSIKRV